MSGRQHFNVRIICERDGLFVRARIVDAVSGELRAISDPLGNAESAIADVRSMLCENERVVA